MNSRTIRIALIVVSLSILMLFSLNIYSLFPKKPIAVLLPQDQVRGAAIFVRGQPYTFNFTQQKMFIEALNQAQALAKMPNEPLDPAAFERIAIYQFAKDDLSLLPLGYQKSHLLFSLQGKIYREGSPPLLEQLLSQTYDQ